MTARAAPPVNAAVWGGHLEQLYHKWAFFQLDGQSFDHRLLVKGKFVQVLVASLPIQTHQAVALQRPPLRGGEESPTAAVDDFEVTNGGVPSVEKYRPGFELLVGRQTLEHLLKMVVFSLTVVLGAIHSVVDRPEVTVVSRGMHQVDQADPLDCTMLISRVLSLYQLDKIGVLLVLNAVIDNDDRGLRIFDMGCDRSPQLRGREALAPQKVADRVVAQVGLVIGQVRTGVIERRAKQVLYVIFFL